jgi:ferritin-like metal-binding protein YciE
MPRTRKTKSQSGRQGGRQGARQGAGQGTRRGGSQKGMTSLQDLFKHELKDIYSGEHLLLDALEELESESTDPNLAEAFAEHRQQTEGHIARLEQVAQTVNGEDGELEAEECPGIEGLIEEKKVFAKERPSPEILDVFNVGAGQKTERYEITAYESLIEMAGKLGLRDAMGELRATLQEEEAALKKLKTLGEQMEVAERM